MTKSTKVAAVNTSATRDHAALAGELSQLALQATYLNQRSASLPNVMGLPDGCTAPLQDIILRAQSTAEAVDANQAVQDAFTAYLAAQSPPEDGEVTDGPTAEDLRLLAIKAILAVERSDLATGVERFDRRLGEWHRKVEKAARRTGKKARVLAREVTLTVQKHMSKYEQRRQLEIKRCAESIAFCETIVADNASNEANQKIITERQRELRQQSGYSILSEPAEMKELDDKMARCNALSKSIKQRVIDHFQTALASTISTEGKSTKRSIEYPQQLAEKHLGDEFGQGLITFIGYNISQMYLVYAYVRRMVYDFDPTRGAHWLPDDKGISPELKAVLAQQSQQLYREMKRNMPQRIDNRIHSEYSFGADPRQTSKVELDDGLMAVHAILSCYTQSDTLYRNSIRDKLYAAAPRFVKESPAKVTQELRKLLAAAEKHAVTLQWELTGAKMLTYLQTREPKFNTSLAKYSEHGDAYLNWTNKSDSAGLIDQMFNDIEYAQAELEAVARGAPKGAHVFVAEIKDKKLRDEFQDKILDRKQKRTADWHPRSENPKRISKGTRCEAIGCQQNVREEWQCVCDDHHRSASMSNPQPLVGGRKWLGADGNKRQKLQQRGKASGSRNATAAAAEAKLQKLRREKKQLANRVNALQADARSKIDKRKAERQQPDDEDTHWKRAKKDTADVGLAQVLPDSETAATAAQMNDLGYEYPNDPDQWLDYDTHSGSE